MDMPTSWNDAASPSKPDPAIVMSAGLLSTTLSTPPPDACVSVRELTKSFSGTQALKRVSLDIMPGEIHALVGGNGSGKSTLVKALAGIQPADGGTITFAGAQVHAAEMTPTVAKQHGFRVVHQDLGVFGSMSVMENLAFGRGYELTRLGRIDWRRQRRLAIDLIERFEIPARPDTLLEELTATARTQVAIARALQDTDENTSGLLVLDEPTASLPAQEVESLLAALRRYRAMGQSILYISHRLGEILELTDRVTALQDGVNVGTHRTAELDELRLVRLIVAEREESVYIPPPPPAAQAAPVLEVKELSAGPLRSVDLTVRSGEIVGLAGLVGSGRSEVLRAIFGDLPVRGGSITIDGVAGAIRHPSDAVKAGVALVPEDRVREAAFLDLTITVNLASVDFGAHRVAGRISDTRMRDSAREAVRRFGVKTNDEQALLSSLSGGNQQKTIVGRWLGRAPRLLLFDEPTQGVDVGARADIYRLLHEAVAEGAAAIVVASDFEELANVVHRAIILRDGRVTAEVGGDDLTPQRLLELTSIRNGEAA